MRSQFVNFLKPIHKLDHHMSDIDSKIMNVVSSTKKFIKDNSNILFTRADKGNTVVTLDRNEYIENMEAYYRYVDDIALSVPLSQLNSLLEKFNTFHHRLKFIMEMEREGDILNFLDLTIIKQSNTLIFDWFRKPIFSDRFLNYHSHHPFTHKRGNVQLDRQGISVIPSSIKTIWTTLLRSF